jgi:hypothetical protein
MRNIAIKLVLMSSAIAFPQLTQAYSPVAIGVSNNLPGLNVLDRLSLAHWRWFA